MKQPATLPQQASQSVRWIWLGLLALAVATRLFGLAATPLSPAEAGRALGAWDAVRSGLWPPEADSSLLLSFQALSFSLLGPSAITARILPALAGVLLIALPWLWRRDLGDLGALVAAGLLLVSPLGLLSARTVNGATIATLGGALLLTIILQSLSDHTSGRLLVVGLVLGLTGGPVFYDVVIAGVVALWIAHRAKSGVKIPSAWRRALVIAVGISLTISVAFGLHWSGWAGITDGLAAWLREWRRPVDPRPNPLGLLLLYEPLLLIAAITGPALLFSRRDGAPSSHRTAPAAWAGCAILLPLLRPGSSPQALVATVFPLALLGGLATEHLWRRIPAQTYRWAGLHVLTASLFWTPGLFALAQHTGNLAATNQTMVIVLGLVVLFSLQALLFVIFMTHLPAQVLWRSTLMSICAVCLFLQISFAGGLVYTRLHPAIEPAIEAAGSPDLDHLRQAVAQLAVTRGERDDSFAIALIDRDPDLVNLVRWALRDYDSLQLAQAWPPGDLDLVIGPETAKPPDTATTTWTGMRFVAVTRASASPPACRQWAPLDCRDAVKWYLYRGAPELPTPTYVTLWQTPQAIN